jgi:hypothetical protein
MRASALTIGSPHAELENEKRRNFRRSQNPIKTDYSLYEPRPSAQGTTPPKTYG